MLVLLRSGIRQSWLEWGYFEKTMLGHFSAGFPLDTYAHVTTSAQKEAAQTMGNLLG